MSDHREDRNRRVEQLGERVRSLSREIAERAAARRRKQNVTTVAGVVLAVLLVFSLSAVTSLSRKLDAETIAQIGRAELENNLPSSRAALEQYLQAEAPRLVGKSLQALIDLLPRMRGFLTRGLNEEIDRINAGFESEVVGTMEECVGSTREVIEERYPDMSEREKIERLVSVVAEKFNANITDATHALYPEYHVQMEEIRASLAELSSKTASELSEEQRIRKDIIETMLRLIVREREARKKS